MSSFMPDAFWYAYNLKILKNIPAQSESFLTVLYTTLFINDCGSFDNFVEAVLLQPPFKNSTLCEITFDQIKGYLH